MIATLTFGARSAAVCALCFTLMITASLSSQGQTTTFTLYSADAKRSVIVRNGNPEMVALEQLTNTFGLTFTEDRVVNGVVIGTRGERIVAIPGQSFVRTAGRVVQLSGPVQRERNTWMVPLDFLTKALAPAISESVVIRRSSKLILVGSIRLPEIGGHVERTAGGAKVVIAAQPATPYKVTRDGNRLTVRFEAVALDATPLTGFIPEFAAGAKVEGPSLIIDLGPTASSHRVDEDRAGGTITIELLAPPPPPPPTPLAASRLRPTPGAIPGPPPGPTAGVTLQLDVASGGLRTIVIDAGHGGEDSGGVSAAGVKEKDLTLQIARRLKAAIESRLGLRVLLTREGDEDVTIDRRTEFANNSKADGLLSLHVNWSARATARGAQVYTLGLDAAHTPVPQPDAARRTVPVIGGGSRLIEPVQWDLAQLPFADQSAAWGSGLVRQFAERSVALYVKPSIQAPMRLLMGANMPAVLIEIGFLSNADDEKALATQEFQSTIIESVIAALTEMRRGR